MTNRTMVFGDDGSIAADLAWLWINSHPWPEWRLEIVSAVTPAVVKVSTTKPIAHEWAPENPRLAFGEARFDDVVQLTIDQDPRIALGRHADLLVIGPRGPGLAKAMHLGSTAEWLLSHPPSPMVVAHHGQRTRGAMVCYDGSRSARLALQTFCAVPWIAGLTVTVVGVDDGRTDVEPAVEEAREMLAGAGANVREEILMGDPTDRLIAYADAHAPDLIVMGTHGWTGLARLKLGSTAGALAHSTNRSILIACDEQTR